MQSNLNIKRFRHSFLVEFLAAALGALCIDWMHLGLIAKKGNAFFLGDSQGCTEYVAKGYILKSYSLVSQCVDNKKGTFVLADIIVVRNIDS